jgi:hypothetical protein
MKGDSYAPGESPIYVTPIEHTISSQRQGVKAISLLKVSQFKVKLEVYSDAYDFQSYARAFVWNQGDLSWKLVYDIPYSLMATTKGLNSYPNGMDKTNFIKDETTLLSNVKKILF